MSKAKINQQRIQNLKDLGMDIPGNLLVATLVLEERIDNENIVEPKLKRYEGYSDLKVEVDSAFKGPNIKHLMLFFSWYRSSAKSCHFHFIQER